MNQRVIVSALVRKGDAFLFLRQLKPGGAYPDTLHIPGGGIEPGEDPLTAVKREVLEEASIMIKNVEPYDFDSDIVQYKGAPTQLIFLRFTGDYDSGQLKAGSDAKELLWIERSRLTQFKHNPPSIRLLQKLGYM